MSQAECGHRSCLARDTSCAFDGRDQGSHRRGTAHDDAEGCHHWSTLRALSGCTRRETLDVLSARPDFCHISDASHKSAEEIKALAGDKSTEHVIFTKRKRNTGSQPNHLDSSIQNSFSAILSCLHQTRNLLKCVKTLLSRAVRRHRPAVAQPRAEAREDQSRRLTVHDSRTPLLEHSPRTRSRSLSQRSDVRDAFAHAGMDDTKTAALIGDGQAFGKKHAACP